MNKRYLLKNKDKEVLYFETAIKTKQLDNLSYTLVYIEKAEIIDEKLLPYNFLKQDKSLIENLNSWINNRKVPKNRAFVNQILATIEEKNNFMAYIDISLGLSLNDSYWIIPFDKNYLWQDYNLYQNPFNETLSLVAFLGYSTKIKALTTSPEYTTNGMLKKCWHKNEETNKIELLKGQSQEYANRGKEAYCEFYMAQIAEVLNFNYLKYDLKEFKNQIVSSCEIFTNQDYGYLPISHCLNKKIDFTDIIDLFIKIMEIYDKEAFYDLLLFDALICNIDRHLGNFGMIVDNNSNKLLKPAPIFDNGLSFINFITENELANIEEALIKNNYNHSFFNLSFEEQVKFAGKKRHIEGLKKLADFKFIKHPKYNLKDKWLNAAEKFIQERSKNFIEIIRINNENN